MEYFKNLLNNVEVLQDLETASFSGEGKLADSTKLHSNTYLNQNKFYEDSLFWYTNKF